jgi:hypothetical protein
MTWELSPSWVKEHAGTKDKQGIAWSLQEQMNEGKPATITFMMDADKARSTPFRAMQMTDNEMLMNVNGKVTIDAYNQLGGTVDIVPNAVGGYTYSGQARSVDAMGKIVNNPIFGTTTTDLNSTVDYFSKMFETFTKGNSQYMTTLKDTSANKIYDAALLNQQ